MASAKRARRSAALMAAGLVAAFLSSADAQTSRRSLADVERDRRAAADEARRLDAQAHSVAEDAARLRTRLAAANDRRSAADAAAEDAAKRLEALYAEADLRRSADASAQRRLEVTLASAMLSSRRADPDGRRGFMLARASAPVAATKTLEARAALIAIERETAETEEETIVLAAAQDAIAAEQLGVSTLLHQRSEARRVYSAQAEAAQRRARQYASEARNLRDLINRASAQRAAPRGASNSGASAIPAAWTSPAQGRIIRAFGAREAADQTARGATLRTAQGAAITAPASGEVAYADVFRGYGRVLILNVDGGYAVVLAGLETTQVQAGARVQAGQSLGNMPNSDEPAPELYVEVRRQGRPIDPGPWLNRGLRAERSGPSAG